MPEVMHMKKPWENERLLVNATKEPITKKRLVKDLGVAGISPGDCIIVHSSMKSIGWIIGGAITVIDALMESVSDQGTLVMPTQSTGNGEPSNWSRPPVPENWWQTIRDELPPYNPEITPTRKMGIIPETFRKYPDVHRSAHPQASFGAWGKHAESIVESHPVDDEFGEKSPLAKLYELDAKILLIGIGLMCNTSLHYAEAKANLPDMPIEVLENGERVWRTWEQLEYDDGDFHVIAADFEEEEGLSPVYIGQAESHIFSMCKLVDYGVDWLKKNREYAPADSN